MKLTTRFSFFAKKAGHWDFGEDIALNVYIVLGGITILTITIAILAIFSLPLQEHGKSLNLCMSSSVSFSDVL